MARSPGSSNVRLMMPSTQGMIIDAPNASRMRPAINIDGVSENAATTEARPKTNRPVSSIFLWPILSARVPIGTSKPAMSSE
ncbi:hypothetical protein D3C78_1482040 [compost metagenome]